MEEMKRRISSKSPKNVKWNRKNEKRIACGYISIQATILLRVLANKTVRIVNSGKS